MKKRLSKWFQHIFIRYIPGTKRLAEIEAKRLSEYIVTNYNVRQQMVIISNIKNNILEYREFEIERKNIEILLENRKLKDLENSLEKLRKE